MSYLFVDVENIALRLIGRLSFEGVPGITPIEECAVGEKKVNPNLLDRIIRQKEAILVNYLSMIYQMPLRLTSEYTRMTLSEIIENLVVAELLPIYYRGGSLPQTGTDPSGLAGESSRKASEMIWVYISGHNMHVPNTNSTPNIPRGPNPQPVVLAGEILLLNKQHPDTITRNETYTGQYLSNQNSRLFDNDLFDFSC